MGALKLRRGSGAFILDGVLLSPDEPDSIIYGTIDFTARPTAQRLMLSAYNANASTVTGAVIYCNYTNF